LDRFAIRCLAVKALLQGTTRTVLPGGGSTVVNRLLSGISARFSVDIVSL
jgi:hypothetical protein